MIQQVIGKARGYKSKGRKTGKRTPRADLYYRRERATGHLDLLNRC